MSKDAVEQAVATAREADVEVLIDAPAPIPLRRRLEPERPYPAEFLGKGMKEAAEAIHNKIQAPLAICAQSVLAATTLATQAHGDVELPTGQIRPSSENFITIADSGERKTSADNEASRAIEAREEELRSSHEVERMEYKNSLEAWETERARIRADKRKYPTHAAMKQALDELGSAPRSPLCPTLTCPEPTYEGLCKLLAIGHPSVGVFSSEGGQFVGGHGMNEDNRLKTAAGLSDLWDGKPIKRVRSGEEASVLPGRRLCVHLMMQPLVANQFLSDRLVANQGLFSRMLIVAPASLAGTRFTRPLLPDDVKAIQGFAQALLRIMRAPLPLVTGKNNELSPRRLRLSPQASKEMERFSDEVEAKLAEDKAYFPIKAFAAKLPEHAARLAATKSLFMNLNAGEIGLQEAQEAIKLAEFYAEEALRLRGAVCVDPDLLLAEKALAWMLDKWKEEHISLPDIYQYGPSGLHEKRDAMKIVSILENHHWLVRMPEGTTVKGQKRRDVWLIVRQI